MKLIVKLRFIQACYNWLITLMINLRLNETGPSYNFFLLSTPPLCNMHKLLERSQSMWVANNEESGVHPQVCAAQRKASLRKNLARQRKLQLGSSSIFVFLIDYKAKQPFTTDPIEIGQLVPKIQAVEWLLKQRKYRLYLKIIILESWLGLLDHITFVNYNCYNALDSKEEGSVGKCFSTIL